MTYIALPLNHFRVVQRWAISNRAKASLDMATFELEIKVRNRIYRMYPQFVASREGRMANVSSLTDSVAGFIGWLPYRPTRWEPGTDKIVFKQLITDKGLAAPALQASQKPGTDYLCKWSKGSFGYELHGPFVAGTEIPQLPPIASGRELGRLFAERFIKGEIVKTWFWGATPIFLHLHSYPTIEGDGASTVQSLVEGRCAYAGVPIDDIGEMSSVWSALKFQGISRNDVLASGSKAWIDYRYGRDFEPRRPTSKSDSRLASVTPDVRAQLDLAGRTVTDEMRRDLPAPMLYSMDGVLADGKIWWIEMNCNPVLPPDGYPVIFDNLFGPQPNSHAVSAH